MSLFSVGLYNLSADMAADALCDYSDYFQHMTYFYNLFQLYSIVHLSTFGLESRVYFIFG